jgi:single-strand DNA-binding protein
MAGSLNKVQLIGRLGKDPEAHTMESGGKVVNFSVATSENWKDRETGEAHERTQWHQIVIFNEALGEITLRHLKKGSFVYLEGQLETRKWHGADGSDRYATEVVLRPYRGEITMLDPPPRAERPVAPRQAASAPSPRR